MTAVLPRAEAVFQGAAYQQARSSYDPYDTIMQWHQQVETLKTVGTDPKAYRAKTEEELLADPEFLRKATERARSHALSNGSNVSRPVRQTPSSSPSLGDVGAGGGDTQVIEPSSYSGPRQQQSGANIRRRHPKGYGHVHYQSRQ